MTMKELQGKIAELEHTNNVLQEQVLSLKTDKTALKCLVARLYQHHPVRNDPECYLNHQVKWWLE